MQSEITVSLPKYLQEEETVSRECQDLISTLPKEKGWLTSHLYKYQGFWYTARYLQGTIYCQNHFQAQDSDILLVTTPKSGTTWLKAVIFTLVNRTRFPIGKNHHLNSQNPHDLVPFLEIKLFPETQNPDFSSFSKPRIFATHLPYTSLPETLKKDCQCKLVYLCRNPKDIFVSLWQFTNRLKPPGAQTNTIQDVLDKFCQGVSLFGPVWEHVLQYWNFSKENHNRLLFLKFEDMKEHPGIQLRRLAEFLGCPFSQEEQNSGLVEDILEICSFKHLSSLEINRNGKLASGEENSTFFRCGTIGDWKNHLTTEMAERVDRITEEKLDSSGLTL
ncbi:cytosolic sulfotransferase 12-like [Andrographis paniculata]|uniref:cytosolic sulfotransferase 12-like n=1 Tax=Andrographis paniculata TaxID=175694 RepID=UPI0021E79A5E|nr:cytosolic sulfotransferase 12-like [Andrographis paniculata]XP_051122721.1 cytosolic sulfotransferase 12-like [Andrographis paniculata]XP_051122723.1 cytosolic sulfotransferase 12-like [Andrographis paniculata]XP_051122724.1 cytosolic sulfotransferase 12-like [Andrographis paniculata]